MTLAIVAEVFLHLIGTCQGAEPERPECAVEDLVVLDVRRQPGLDRT